MHNGHNDGYIVSIVSCGIARVPGIVPFVVMFFTTLFFLKIEEYALS